MLTFVERPALLWLLVFTAIPLWLLVRSRGRKRLRAGSPTAHLRGVLLCLTVGASAIAAAGPRRAVPSGETFASTEDVVVVLDVSMSMLAGDVRPTRLAEARRQLLDRLGGERAPRRIGVVLFAGDARVACPLTADRDAVRQALESASEDGAAAGGSDIAAGLERASAMLNASQRSGVLLVTDGDSGPGNEADPLTVARRLAVEGVDTFVIGVGSVDGATTPVRGAGRDSVVAGADGRARLSKRDTARLQVLATAARGSYASLDPGRQLPFALPAARMPTSAASGPFGPMRWHGIPLAIALAALTVDTMLWWLGRPSTRRP